MKQKKPHLDGTEL